MTTRAEIEQYILGCMLLDTGAAVAVLDILKPNNFKQPLGAFLTKQGKDIKLHYSDVFRAMRDIYPARDINSISVVERLCAVAGIDRHRELYFEMLSLMDGVGSTQNTQYWSFILVQESVSELLEEWISRKVTESQRAALNATDPKDPILQREQDFAQIRHRLKLMPDVFDKVDALRKFFSDYGYTDEVEEMEEMASNVNARIATIRQQTLQNNILRSVGHMANGSHEPESVKVLLDTVIKMADPSFRPSPKLINHIDQLSVLA